MKGWYQSAFCKGILILLAHISLVAVMICVLIGLAYPGKNYGDLFIGQRNMLYEETAGFAKQIQEDMSDIFDVICAENKLSTDGEINLEKVIDIPVYHDKEEIAAVPGEFSFKLKDLVAGTNHMEEKQIIVCKRKEDTDLKYQYFTAQEFVDFVKENKYHFSEKETGMKTEEILDSILEDESTPTNGAVYNNEKKKIFEEIWNMDRIVNLKYKTAEGKTLLELANESAKWNGKLNEMEQIFRDERSSIMQTYEDYESLKDEYKEGNSNFSYLFIDYDKGVLRTNRAEYSSMDKSEESIRKMAKSGKYIMLAPTLKECSTNIELINTELAELKHRTENTIVQGTKFAFIVSVNTEYPIQDLFYAQNLAYGKYMPWMDQAVWVLISAAIVFFICVVWLTAAAGHSNKEEGIALLFYDKWKTEIGLFFIMSLMSSAVGMGVTWIGERLSIDWNPWYWQAAQGNITSGKLAEAVLVTIGCCAAFMTGYLSLVRRIKAKTLWKNSILKWLVHSIAYIYNNRSSVTKGVIVGSVLFLINLLMMTNAGFFVLLAVVTDAFTIVIMIKRQIEKEKIKKGIIRIVEGDSEYKIVLEGLSKDNREIAEHVNHIGEGIQNAVEKSLKDERLKTDLITNVSHDIKTPLTSIINYVGLLKQEKFEDEKVQRYLDILDRKSQRLKTLTEDVVEASKISSGNINLEFVNLNLVEMIHQTTGEFTEKFEKRDLKIVLNVPEEPVIIRVDGRRMWRVIENVYNNAAKYAMPGTRIYADMSANGNTVRFSLKNVSEYPLNITADELTERFIRGDISRSTEGSGLGLSIAKNLTEMQGGQFDIYVDGDLFKVTVTFPQIKK